ncbi:HTH-type transcriptional repressor GlcR [Aquisphaera giovannonii]|uniref:HTH-type transcriptional repressor GlcR n=1 Tax=Aquisphaera giovannonii TaxID=406548 RepID=A0A5B9VX50_9BACT|nr:DeoR/GlpR family DNA-binding transcription regulator [Aquisphaera giovannonii]QEH32527.1 HTH-type transcriptional repressor GlcR [Aquisphaera giovannonii]
MLTAERKRWLLDVLKSEGKLLASDLSKRLGVSEDTVRRDLRELDKAGLLQRVHGGALPRSQTSIDYTEREKESTEAKEEIGEAAARLLRPGEVVAIDGGTTPLAVAEHLPADLALTVVTHSLPAVEVLSGHPKVDCVVVGGRLIKRYRATVGIAAVDAYRMLRPDACVLGAAGVHPVGGVTIFDGEEAEVKRAMVEHAARVIVVVAGEKLGTVAPYLLIPASRITHLVTDPSASEDAVQSLRELGVEVVVA